MSFFMFLVFLLVPLVAESMTPPGLNDDVLGLIVFKADLLDPHSKLSSWNEDDEDPCSWAGVECDPKSNRVAELSLSSFSLSGKIGRGLLQLRFLSSLSLSNNNFSGTLLTDLVRLESLRNLDLSGNSLSGPIPKEFFSQCRSIRSISLASNTFTGEIPSSVGSCSTLAALNLSSNRLSGSLPAEIWSLNALRSLDLSGNALVGEVPVGMSKMYNLRTISLRWNQLSGPLPEDIGDSLLLESIDFSVNSLTGSLLDSMQNLSLCSFLSLSWNSFSGEVPSWIGGLKSLQTLDLSGNEFSGQLPDSLGNLQYLKELKVSRNSLNGSLPDSVATIKSLVDVDFSRNKLTGNIPSWIFEPGFVSVTLSENKLSGPVQIPTTTAPTLQILDLSGNALSGNIPMEISGINSLQSLNLSSNSFSGAFPVSIGDLKSLQLLDLSGNRLNGSIPLEIGEAVSLRELNLERNSMTGGIPAQIGNCSLLTSLDLSENSFTGQIPSTIADLTNLRIVDLSVNHLTGSLPKPLSNLPHLLSFNISHNHLSGALPSGNFFNTISPSSISDNPGLCGAAVNLSCPSVLPKPIVMDPISSSPISSSSSVLPSASHKKIILSISALVAIAAAIIITVGVITITILNLRVRASAAAAATSRSPAALEFSGSYLSQSPTTDANSGKLVMFSGDGSEYFNAGTHALLNKDCELGRGGFGAVYKTSLRDGRPMAIKKLTISSLVKSLEDFEREVKKLGKISHPNLVSLQGYYWTPSLQLLIYEFVSGGSLHKHLHDSSSPLTWQERFDILVGTARSLAHLHQLDIIHYNMKSSNVLIDGFGEAKVTDYGLARLLPMLDRYVLSSKMQSALGYMAPEFGCGSGRVTEKCDVYGFGVLVLEVITGRRPVEYMDDDVVVLCDVVRGALEEGRVEEVVDGRLCGRFPVEEAIPVVKLGLICTSQVPSNRPDMGEVVNILDLIRCPRDSTEDELV
ncbi:putative LRR receptor-like serine/threonine-protein kinase IRK [Iris pallida]|uniref:LRR receptor-like serine/threonine-protein kinase IRK n=1 Tax=Iris pallida TaxID=29817 RepID=A0AAX6F559_IRIPA|nr:putative LRR receptor-like serine/threonine-protein kinase IRK [Iris pallida]